MYDEVNATVASCFDPDELYGYGENTIYPEYETGCDHNTEFAEDVVFTVHIPVGDAKAILKEITDATNARAQIEEQDEIFG